MSADITDLIFERDYAREMLFVAIRSQTEGSDVGDADSVSQTDITALIDQAVEVGCGRNQLIVELAILGARLFTQSAQDNRPAHAREIVDHVAC